MFRVPKIRGLGQLRFALLAAAMVALITVPGVLVPQGGELAFAAGNEAGAKLEPSIVVAPNDPVMSSADSDFRFEALLKNPSDVPISAGTVVLTIDNQRAEVADDLQLSGERAALELSRIEVIETPGGQDQRIEAVVERDDFPILFSRAAGVYPVHAEFFPAGAKEPPFVSEGTGFDPIKEVETEAERETEAGLESSAAGPTDPDALAESEGADDTDAQELHLVASTAIVWNGIDDVSPLPLTLVVPIVLPSSVQTLPTRDELTRHSSRLLQVFSAAEQHHATIAIDPRIIAGIRSLGTAAPSGATELLHRFERSVAPIFLLQFADADPAVQASLGMSELMQPLGLSYATQLGTFEPSAPPLTPTEPTEPTEPAELSGSADPPSTDSAADEAGSPANVPTSEPEAPLVDPVTGTPTMAGLLTLENSRPGAWPAGGDVDSATFALLQNSGLTSLVLDSTNVSNATSSRVTIGNFDALIADTAAGAAVRKAMAGETATERSAGAADLTTRLALSAQNSEGGAVLALDRGAIADLADPLRIFQTIDDIEWVQTTSERQLPGGTATLRAGAPDEDRRELLRASILRSTQIDELAPLLEHPTYLLEYQRERVLGSLASRYAEPGIDFAEVDAAIGQRDSELLEGVRPIVTESTQLVGTLSNLPVTLSNALPFEATVSLMANPISAAITLPERVFEVRVPAAGSSAVLIPVRSRISSGNSGLALEVRDQSGEHSFSTAMFPLTLRTAIETILIWVLGSAAALLLGFGILRSIRRTRSANAEPHEANELSDGVEQETETPLC